MLSNKRLIGYTLGNIARLTIDDLFALLTGVAVDRIMPCVGGWHLEEKSPSADSIRQRAEGELFSGQRGLADDHLTGKTSRVI